MTQPALIRIAAGGLSAEIDLLGAELHQLRDAEGHDLLWNGDAAWWTGRAPILFPIVGALAGDRYRLDGASYAMAKHGFARRKRFELVSRSASAAVMRLSADAETRAAYPFEFELDVAFAIKDATLTLEATVRNLGAAPMPASFGLHPAFLWPLPGSNRGQAEILFQHEEPAPIRRLAADGTLDAEPRPSPVDGRTLRLEDGLFEIDAIIFDRLVSRRLRYGSPGEAGLEIAWEGLPQLGVWTKPGAPYLCIEPWHGYADPAGYDGDFRDKPGSFQVAAGGEQRFAMSITSTSPQGQRP